MEEVGGRGLEPAIRLSIPASAGPGNPQPGNPIPVPYNPNILRPECRLGRGNTQIRLLVLMTMAAHGSSTAQVRMSPRLPVLMTMVASVLLRTLFSTMGMDSVANALSNSSVTCRGTEKAGEECGLGGECVDEQQQQQQRDLQGGRVGVN